MITKIAASNRHFNDFGWLKTYWLFSFSNYSDPANVEHGMLRVLNDDIVEPHTGFETHPHEEMEIISIILDGEMVHKDTMGNECVIRKDDVQRMTAGTGLYHSEKNTSNEDVHFLQIWIRPDKEGLHPSYDQKSYSPQYWRNKLALLASNRGVDVAVSLNTEAEIYRAAFDREKTVEYHTSHEKKVFLYVMGGEVTVNDHPFSAGDQARISEISDLIIKGKDRTEFLLIDVPAKV